ncbi:MAG: type II secretion system F family protein [Achromobacter sp.]|uniref:type II secretion system F family protein n=1 Tax=Achromobacter sp. TaxID=134375 RepID=UPI003CFD12D3
MWLVLAMAGAAWGPSWITWRLLRRVPWAIGRDLALPWWWRMGAPWIAWLAPRLVPLCPRRGYAWLSGRVSRAGLPAAVRAEHFLAQSLLAAVGGALLAGVGLTAGLADSVTDGALPGMPLASGLAAALPWILAGAGLAGLLPGLWLRARGVDRCRRIERGLPFVLDMMILCVEAGLSAQGALLAAASSGPGGPLRDSLADALAQMRAGVTRAVALRAMAQRCGSPLVHDWVTALAQADALGISLAPVLRAQVAQCRHVRQQRAEQQALRAPVKMLLPLIGCIFPCTFIVLAFPIAVQLLRGAG